MPQLTASLESASRQAAIPKAIYRGHVTAEKTEFSRKTSAPMIALQFECDDAEYRGRALPGMGGWYYIMAGGNKEDGSPYDVSRLFETINALGAEWSCRGCNTQSTKRFSIQKANGTYHYLCPTCGQRADIEVNGSWIGLSCKLVIDTEKMQDSDDDRNVIKRLVAASE